MEYGLKADPYAFKSELRPNTASIIVNRNLDGQIKMDDEKKK